MKKKILRSLCLGLILGAGNASAAVIDVLWYGGNSFYNTLPTTLASNAGDYDPNNDGSLDWNVDIWEFGEVTPDFSLYDVFIIPSWLSGMDPNRLLDAKTAITDARGSRTFLSGQDADYHYLNGPGAIDNGPRGFFINAVNWAASGTGLGIVALADGWAGTGSTWMNNVNSFLYDELNGHLSYFQEEQVNILPGQENFPVNEGLTSAGLSNWGTSSHMGFSVLTPGYEMINAAGGNSQYAVTLVTEGQADGGTDGGGTATIPEPASLAMLTLGLFGLGFTRKSLRKN